MCRPLYEEIWQDLFMKAGTMEKNSQSLNDFKHFIVLYQSEQYKNNFWKKISMVPLLKKKHTLMVTTMKKKWNVAACKLVTQCVWKK